MAVERPDLDLYLFQIGSKTELYPVSVTVIYSVIGKILNFYYSYFNNNLINDLARTSYIIFLIKI